MAHKPEIICKFGFFVYNKKEEMQEILLFIFFTIIFILLIMLIVEERKISNKLLNINIYMNHKVFPEISDSLFLS